VVIPLWNASGVRLFLATSQVRFAFPAEPRNAAKVIKPSLQEAKMNGKNEKREKEIYFHGEEKNFEEELNKQIGVMSECLFFTIKEFIKLQNIIYCHNEHSKKKNVN
jgi:hypothetical protein